MSLKSGIAALCFLTQCYYFYEMQVAFAKRLEPLQTNVDNYRQRRKLYSQLLIVIITIELRWLEHYIFK